METTELISRTEQKRRAQGLEELAAELVALPLSRQQHLPCEERLRVIRTIRLLYFNVFTATDVST